MSKIWVACLLLLITPELFARGSTSGDKEAGFTSDRVSMFVLSAGSGVSYPRLLNQDGTYANFQGYPLAVEGELKFMIQTLGLGAGIFGTYTNLNSESASNTNERKQTLTLTENLYGIKMSLYPFFAGMGYGNISGHLSDSQQGTGFGLSGTLLGFTGGLKLLNLGGVSLSFQGWYKNVTFQKNQNPGLTNNTTLERLDFLLMISIDPVFNLL